MQLASISDLHIKEQGDIGWKTLMDFLQHPEVQTSDKIVLLGDIFDLVVGPHQAYLDKFNIFFKVLRELLSKNKEIYYFEGNHDLHLDQLFAKALWGSPNIDNFKLFCRPETILHNQKKILLTHGDEFDHENHSYQRYKKFINRRPLKFIANHIMPYSVLNYFGTRASSNSRAKGKYLFDSEEVKTKTRNGLLALLTDEVDIVVSGHSHVVDFYEFKPECFFINNGFPVESRRFIIINENGCYLESLLQRSHPV